MSSPSSLVIWVERIAFIALPALFTASIDAAHAAPGSACDAAHAPRDAYDMQVPFEVIDGRIYVQAKVNGQAPLTFALDTGASGLGRADASLVTRLGLPIEKPILNSDGVKTAEADTTRFDTLDVGGLVRHDLNVITRDYNSKMAPEAAFSGIIAREFFADGVLVIDYPRKTVSFSRRLALSPGQAGVLAYERPFRVPVSIGDIETVGNLDTGANVAFVLPQALFDQIGNAPAEAAGKARLSNVQVDTQRAKVHGPFRVGDLRLTDVEVRISERYPELLVGAHALQGAVVVIDQRSKAVAVCR
ncbi:MULTISPECIES: pepsin/retropepsin-like aspartic protease family protein [unclassified Pseudoxanthomonas]|uniref:pepsin/retropepsin-like aspartic protease family protein n=1 Tax=unclassified Pseudoxanthomonas TaxID=2645906 RepID=UPI0008E318DF|nr:MULTISPECIES: pepsin/retropepsin-like aspartic protease family protein [unclassified Pseudoxanthomonas]SFV27601.1 Aspartyl protease [Pseudoxanthomonas sp. YR558]